MGLSGLLVFIQLLVVGAMLLVVLMAHRTSRRQRGTQKAFLSMAVGLTIVSLLGMLWLMLETRPSRAIGDMSYWLALCIPAITVVLCGWSVRRALDKGRRRSSQRRPDEPDSALR